VPDGTTVLITTTQEITSLTLALNGASAIFGGVTFLAAGTATAIRFYQPTNSWYQINAETTYAANVQVFLATPSSANLRAAMTDETGTGLLVFNTSPTLVTPALGTPSALVGTNITGTAAGLTAGNVTTNANLTGAVTSVGNAATVVTNANLTGDVTSVGNATSIAAGVIVNADINASAGIVDTKLATISTASKVSNSATTATSANTANAIVARDASGNFSAGTITAALTGNASTVTTNANLTGDVTSSGNATTLATVNPNVGSFTFSSITVNAKGLITAASSGSAPVEFVSGTAITFNQTSAPTGWTKSLTHDNKALRVVTGTVGTGGSVGFTTALATPTVTGTTSISVSISGTTGATTLSTSQIPSHSHGVFNQTESGPVRAFSTNTTSPQGSTAAEGGGGSHTHSFSGSGSGSGSLTSGVATINVQYVDVIIATKN
jgi:hypothetical protein